MASGSEKPQIRVGGAGETSPTPTGSSLIPDETREDLTALMQELLMNAHELSFEYSTMDCNHIANCPLAVKAKDLFRTVKKLHQLMRKIAPPVRPSATSVR